VLPSLTVNKSFAGGLASVTSYFQRDFRRVTTARCTTRTSSPTTTWPAGVHHASHAVSTPQQLYQTQTVLAFLPPGELRRPNRADLAGAALELQGHHDRRIATTWTAGLYYNDQHRRFLDDEYIPGLQAASRRSTATRSTRTNPWSSLLLRADRLSGVSFANDLIYFGHTYPVQEQIAPSASWFRDHAGAQGGRRPALRVRKSSESSTARLLRLRAAVTYVDHEKYSATTRSSR